MLLGVAIMTAFMPGVIGLASITSWAVMWLVMPILLLKCKIEITIIHILGIVFLSYAALSLLWSPHGMLEFMQLLALASVFVWGSSLKDLRNVTIGLSIGLGFSSVLAIFQFFGIEIFVYTYGGSKPTGLFINPNIFAEISGMLLFMILANKLWWFIPVTIPGLLVSSRAVVLGLGVSMSIMIWNKFRLLSVLIVIASLSTIYFITFPQAIADNAPVNAMSIQQRLYMWQDMIAGFTPFGNGIGSFIFKFPEFNTHLDSSRIIAEYAHNDLLQLIFELGIGAIPLLIMVALLLMVKNDHKSAFLFFIIIGMFGFPLHTPVASFMLALVASQLAKCSLGNSNFVYNFRSILPNRLETIRYS